MVSPFAITQTIGQLGSGAMLGVISAPPPDAARRGAYAAANVLIATANAAVPLIVSGLAGLGGGLSIIAERLYIARVADQARLAFTNGIVSAAAPPLGVRAARRRAAILAANDLRVPFILVAITASVAMVSAIAFLPPDGSGPSRPRGRPGELCERRRHGRIADAGVAIPAPLRSRRHPGRPAGRRSGRSSACRSGTSGSARPRGMDHVVRSARDDALGMPAGLVPWIFGASASVDLPGPVLARWGPAGSPDDGRDRVRPRSLNAMSMVLAAPIWVVFGTACRRRRPRRRPVVVVRPPAVATDGGRRGARSAT
jgi:hypothetical protein